jgi:hypothetical protein
MAKDNGQYPKSDELKEAADQFNKLLDQYGPRPGSSEALLEQMDKQMPRYALATVCGFGVIGALVGLAVGVGMTQHAAPGMAAFCGIWGLIIGLLVRQTRWAYAYIFGATMFAARGLLPWECMWNALKHYPVAFATMHESYTAIQEFEAQKKAEEDTHKGKGGKKAWYWKRRRKIHIEKKL